MTTVPHLREAAESLAEPLPPLLAEARHLATNVLLGAHGRRRAGMGDEFWQYRHAGPGDGARAIDWRRSARADGAHFVREKEWQAAQSVDLWIDEGASMDFASRGALAPKSHRARLLGLAIAALLIRGGERVGLSHRALAPRTGEVQMARLAALLADPQTGTEYGGPPAGPFLAHSRAVFISDFLGDPGPVMTALAKAADLGVQGVLLQVLDPAEEDFPYDGRTRFRSMAGAIEFETLKAGNLRDRYRARLARRKAALVDQARICGWQYSCHRTDSPAMGALLWLYQALEGMGR